MQETKTKTQPTQHGSDIDRHSNVVIRGHVINALSKLEDQSVHMVVTSPPYWGLRDYGTPDVVFSDGWSGTLGLEPDPQSFISHMVEIFREVRRVLRDDGTLWLNIGDSYAGCGGGKQGKTGQRSNRTFTAENMLNKIVPGLKPKDMVGIPWWLAFALQADGWYLRSDIIWHKPNPMPESVTDRPTKSYEHIFLLSKSARYFYDQEAIREKHEDKNVVNGKYIDSTRVSSDDWEPRKKDGLARESFRMNDREYNPAGRNKRDVWTSPYPSVPRGSFCNLSAPAD